MDILHQPILLTEILESFKIQPKSNIADVTCGEGGHSLAFARLNPQGTLICLDRNTDILEVARERLKDFSQVRFVNDTFDHLDRVRQNLGLPLLDGILADLGISMFHLKNRGLGFSFEDAESLDMNLDGKGTTAKDVVNHFKEDVIADILYKYGEEYESRRIARAIVQNRPIETSKELANIITRAKKQSRGRIHAATKSFQALRIYVNREWELLESFLPLAVDQLRPGGKLAVITFHSLEDRIVKWRFREMAEQELGTIITKKPLIAGEDELQHNPASRSAKLRIFEKRM